MDGCHWLVSNKVDDCLQRQIAQKIFKSKIKAHPVNTGHQMACKHHISFVTDLSHHLTANFGHDCFRIMPDIVCKLFCAAKSLC